MKRLLLIEDDHWLADSYKKVLAGAYFSVDHARSGDEAMRAIETSQPDVIVADVLLEGHTVLSLLHELQSYDDTAAVPVILCTSLSHPSIELKRLHSYGVHAVLDKATMTPEQLIQTVKEAVA